MDEYRKVTCFTRRIISYFTNAVIVDRYTYQVKNNKNAYNE